MTRTQFLAGVILILASARAEAQDASDLAKQARAILKTHCHRCHGEQGAVEGGFPYLLDRRQLVARHQVIPGDPEKSQLLRRVVQKEMPPPTEKQRPSPAEEAVLRQWLKAGAPDWQPPAQRAWVTLAGATETMWQDLAKVPEDDRRFMRYLTLTHLYNAGVAEDELETYRQALSKLVNSLSWAPQIAVPTAIDPARTIFRIDLRDYKWTKRTWGILSGGYPYTVLSESEAERNCREGTQVERFHLRADWFAAYATSPDYYQQILQLPPTAAELKKLFGLADQDDLTNGRVQRAGFLGSRVTPAARLIERHESHFGGFWIAYQFADKKQPFEHPLARPASPHATGTQQALFHLPNGLLGYAVWDGNQRVQEAAQGIQDVRRKGAPVRPALSCMSCHTGGVLGKEDEVQAHAIKDGLPKDTLDKIAILYPTPKKFAAIVEEDAERFLSAVKKTGARQGSAEPIVALALRHEEHLDLPLLAAELGLTPAQLQKQLAATQYAKVLGQAGGKGVLVKRQAFLNLYAELAQALGLGKAPVRVAQGGTPVVYAEMLLPARGTPVELVEAKKPEPAATTRMPNPATVAVANLLQALPLRDHLVCRFPGYRGELYPVALAPKERLAASESRMGVVSVYDPVTVEKRYDLEGHKAAVSAIKFSPDGKYIVTASLDGTAKIWRASSGLLLVTLPHKGAVTAVQFAADGKTLATVGGGLHLWTVPLGKAVERKLPEDGPTWNRILALSPDLKTLAAVGAQFGLWDVATGQQKAVFKSPPGGAPTVADYSPDGKWLASSGTARTIVLWDVATAEAKASLKGHAEPVNALAFSLDGKLLISGSGKTAGGVLTPGELKVWEVDIESHWKTLEGHARAVTGLSVGAAGKLLASAGADGTVRLWSLDKDAPAVARTAPFGPFEGHLGQIIRAALSRDERHVLTAGSDGTVRLWDAQNGTQVKQLAGHTRRIRAVAFSVDGTLGFSAGDDLKLVQWDLAKGTAVKKWDLPARTTEMLFSHNGKYLVVGTADGLVGQIHTSTGRMVRKLENFGGLITSLACSADDRLVAVADIKRNVAVWDLGTEKVRHLRGKHDGPGNNPINSLAFSPDSELLVSGSAIAKTANLWDLKTGDEIHRIGPFPGYVVDVRFAADGRSFFISSGMTGFQPKSKTAVLMHCSITQADAATGQVIQFWDQFPDLPTHVLRVGEGKQLLVVVGNSLMRLSTENGKTVSAP